MSFLAGENAVDLYAGQSKTLRLQVSDAAGDPVDLTGARVVLTVKCDAEAVDPKLVKDSARGASQVEITAPREGLVYIYLDPGDTRGLDPHEYVYDVWVDLGGRRYPVVQSTLVVRRAITVM